MTCQALRDLRIEAWKEGFKKGFKKGYKEGYKKGYKEGVEEGMREGLSWVAHFVKSGDVTLELAARTTGMSEAEFVARTGLKL